MEECMTFEDANETLRFHNLCRSMDGELLEFRTRAKDMAENVSKSLRAGDLKVLSYRKPGLENEEDGLRIDIKRLK